MPDTTSRPLFPGTTDVSRSIFWLALTDEQQAAAELVTDEQERRALVAGWLQSIEAPKGYAA
jgi:hypothetical protein